MLDFKLVRENTEQVRAAIRRRGSELDLTEFLALDVKRRAAQQELETLRRKRNEVSEEIGRLKKAGKPAEDKVAEMRAEGEAITALENSGREAEEAQRNILLVIPNLPHASVPDGKNEDDNVEIRRWSPQGGEPPKFSFEPKPHWDIAEYLDIIDFERAAKIDDIKVFGYVPVRFGLKRKLRRLSSLRRPPPDFHVVVLVFSVRHGGVRQVRDHEQDVPLSFLRLAAAVLERGYGLAFRAHLGDLVFRGFPRLLEPADLLGDLIALAPERLQLLLSGPSLHIKRKKLREVEFAAAPADRRPDLLCVFPDQLKIEHLK